ncbi:glycosyltransferase [Dyadobacter sp. UC 10]|nr:glycosyltransferase [Dyadobacter sp. UC 10]
MAPILLFVYNRLDTLKLTVDSLLKNPLASESTIFIFSDAAKNAQNESGVAKVRAYIRQISGFKEVNIIEAAKNLGLANSIISGVSKVISKFGKVIVLEDDLLLASNFLTFMNKSLDFYENNPDVFSISGFIFDMKIKGSYDFDIFFTKRHCSWGWAIWKDRWEEIDWSVKDYDLFMNSTTQQKKFDELGSDLSDSLKRQMNGQINSWAIRCNYHQFKKQTYTVYPVSSKVDNLGFGVEATHTNQKFNKYKTTLERSPKFEFALPEFVFEDKALIRTFTAKYSKLTRLYYFLLNKIFG